MSSSTTTHTVAIFGARGYLGKHIFQGLLDIGQKVVVFTQSTDKAELEALAAQPNVTPISFPQPIEEGDGVAKLAQQLRENQVDTVIVVRKADIDALTKEQAAILEAAKRAGTVKRFVPNEFGVNTLSLPQDIQARIPFFKAKADLHQAIFDSGLEWTFVFPGGFFGYFLPTLRFGGQVNTWGDDALPVPLHAEKDIGAIVARAAIDPRTANKALQITKNMISQKDAVALTRKLFPQRELPVKHTDSEQLDTLQRTSDPASLLGILSSVNYAIYVRDLTTDLKHPLTVIAEQLYPDYEFQSVESGLTKEHVFGDSA